MYAINARLKEFSCGYCKLRFIFFFLFRWGLNMHKQYNSRAQVYHLFGPVYKNFDGMKKNARGPESVMMLRPSMSSARRFLVRREPSPIECRLPTRRRAPGGLEPSGSGSTIQIQPILRPLRDDLRQAARDYNPYLPNLFPQKLGHEFVREREQVR